MKELGEYLKETRENNCVGLEEAASDLNMSLIMLENIEKGNSRAFKDMLELKDKVKDYARYLGLNPEEVVDEFNDFLFQHTSRINLNDILEAEKKQEEKKEIISPYTKNSKIKEKDNNGYLKYIFVFILTVLLLALLFRKITKPDDTTIGRELKGINGVGDIYEFAK